MQPSNSKQWGADSRKLRVPHTSSRPIIAGIGIIMSPSVLLTVLMLVQVQMGFDGETSSLALLRASSTELPRGEQLQRILSKLNALCDEEAVCAAGEA